MNWDVILFSATLIAIGIIIACQLIAEQAARKKFKELEKRWKTYKIQGGA